jgi:inorganic pyrophosphatase/exopolyphosphatase
MTPVNNKSLIAFLFDQMNKLDENLIDVEQAKAQANLAKQVNNAMKYELDLAKVKMEISEFNTKSLVKVDLRNVESKNFE